MLAALIDGMNDGGGAGGAGAAGVKREKSERGRRQPQRLEHVDACSAIIELCWGDVGLLLSMPRQGLGNAAIAAVADEEQLERFGGRWAAMAITEPGGRLGLGRDPHDRASSTATSTCSTARRSTSPPASAPTLVVVWASLDRSHRPRRDQVVRRRAIEPRAWRSTRLEHKLGIRASDTATFPLEDCRVPKENLLGSAGDRHQEGLRRRDADLRQHAPARRRDGGRRRPRLRSSARASCSRRPASRSTTTRPRTLQTAAAAELLAHGGRLEAARLLTLQAAWMADNGKPNSLEASMAKAKAGPHRRRRSRCAASSSAAPPATPRPSCSRSGRATRRSSTSSRARSRSSC